MPEPNDNRSGSWFIKGPTEFEMMKSCKNEDIDAYNGTSHNAVLLDCMFERFLDECKNKSEQTALIEYVEGEKVENMKKISYVELNKQANNLARVLIRKLEADMESKRAKSNKDGDFIVALRFLQGIDLVLTILALIKAGLAYVPIAPNWPDGRIKMLLEDCQPIWAITNIKADPLYNATSSLEKENKPFPKIFQVCDLIQSHGLNSISENDAKIDISSSPVLQWREKNKDISNGRLLAILYTSGSTGIPKGARIMHKGVINRLKWQWNEFPYQSGDVCAFKTTLTFIDSILEIFGPLLKGFPLVIIPKPITQNVESFVNALSLMKITRLFAVTSLLRNVLTFLEMQQKQNALCNNLNVIDKDSEGKNTSLLHRIYQWECSAEPVTVELVKQFYRVFDDAKENTEKDRKICNFYGSTEMSDATYAIFRSVDDLYQQLDDNEKVPIGIPVLNSAAYILNDKLQPVETPGTVGQLFISSPNLATGYCGGNSEARGFTSTDKLIEIVDDKKLKEVSSLFHKSQPLYRTGDYAKIYNSRLYYYGRADSQIKIRGHRVDLSEIEKSVVSNHMIDRVAVIVYKPNEPTQKVLCYFTLKSTPMNQKVCNKSRKEKEFTGISLKEKLKTVLPDYMMPNSIIKLKGMPLLVNGKTDRQKLMAMYEDSLKFEFTFSSKELEFGGYLNEEEFEKARVLLGAVTKVLGFTENEKPSLDSNFFDIGGDSLNMVQVIGHCADVGYVIGMTEFAICSNLAEIIKSLQSQSDHTEQLSIPSVLKIEELKAAANGFGYTSEDMNSNHKAVVVDMISRSFAEKGDLTTLAKVTYDDLYEQVTILWESLLEANLSFVIRDSTREEDDQIIGACLNFDARSKEAEPLCAISAFERANVDNVMKDEDEQSEPNEEMNDKKEEKEVPMTVVEFLQSVEEPLKDEHLPAGLGKTIYTSLLGTSSKVCAADNVKLTLFMEMENIRIAKARGFKGIFTTNANRLTQHVSRILDYEILRTIQINQYEDDYGHRPFQEAPDDLVTEIAVKFF